MSQDQPKRRRGRPRVMPPEWQAGIRKIWGVHTDRQAQAHHYARIAMEHLELLPQSEKLPPPTWLVDWQGAETNKIGAVKWSVLEQLGRMLEAGYSVADCRRLMAEMERLRLSAKHVATRLREIRLDR